MDIWQKFLLKTLQKFIGTICIQFANLENRYISENDCNFTFRFPNLLNDISNKTYRSTECKEVKKLWSKVMSSSELKFFINTLIWDALYIQYANLRVMMVPDEIHMNPY